MNRGESSAPSETLLSQDSNKRFGRIIGFDLASSALSCSISTDETPKTVTAFKEWTNGSKTEPLFPACIQYKNWSITNCSATKVGFEGLSEQNSLEEGDFYIPSVKDHVIQWITKGSRDSQPNASLVLKDFFQAVRAHLENAFKKFNEKLNETQEHSNLQPEQETRHYSLDDCRFYFALPDNLSCTEQYANLLAKAFKQVGFLKEEDSDNRLIFMNDVAAVGYNYIPMNQIAGGETNCLVVDIGFKAAKFSVVQCKQTVRSESVLQLGKPNVMSGYGEFSDNFRNYITSISMPHDSDISQHEEVDALVVAFEGYQKVKINLSHSTEKTEFVGLNKTIDVYNSDLQEYVFSHSYLESIFNSIAEQCQAYSVDKIIFRAQYCQGPYFYLVCEDYIRSYQEKLPNAPKCVFSDESKHLVSNGAVLYGLEAQVPLLVGLQTSLEANKNTYIQRTESNYGLMKRPILLGLPKGHFAVGIDFGSTFSGCSYADISNMKAGEKWDILTIEYWDRDYKYPKVPTALRYNTRSGSFSKLWGYDAWKPQNRLKDDVVKLEFFKLLLSPENVERFYGNGNRQIEDVRNQYFMVDQTSTEKKPIKTTKTLTPVDIIAKYLKYLNTKIKEYLTQKTKVPKTKLRLKYVITVPAMWTNTGRAAMLEAAIEAGLVKSGEDKCIQLITEPEAAALSCENFMKEAWKLDSESYKDGLIFTVFDAGGGTVDLVTFQQTVEKTDDKEETRIEQIGDGTGDTCGAIYLDKRCREVITDFYTEAMGQRPEKGFIDHHVEYFKENYKEHFMPIDRPDAVYRIPLPPHPRVPQNSKPKPYKESGSPDRPKARCRLVENNSVLEISRAEVQRCIFDPVVDRAVGVLREHLKNTKEHRPSAILLVGGFSQSKYLQYKIQRFCDQEGIPHMSVPPDGVTAISRGAVSYFLEPHRLSKKMAPSSHLSNLQVSHQALTDTFDSDRQSTSKSVGIQSGTIYSGRSSSALGDLARSPTVYADLNNEPHKTNEYLAGPADYSMYYYFVGIDIGSNSISCSYTNLYDQTEVQSITEWSTNPKMEDEYSTDSMLEQESFFERYPTCILYKGMNQRGGKILCGYDALLAPKTANDLFIPNIKTLLNNTAAQTLSSKLNYHELSAFTVVKDFLKGFLKHLRPILIESIREDLHSQFAQDSKIVFDPEHYILKKGIDERRQHLQRVLGAPSGLLENCQFNIVWPENSDARSKLADYLISKAFVESGEFGPDFNTRRLRFTTRADAAAYTCLWRPIYMSELKYQRHYLVCDIGYTSVTFAKIVTGNSAAVIEPIVSLDTVLPGVEIINDHFKDYLYKNKTYYGIASESQIEDLVLDFSEQNLKTIFDLSEEEGSFVRISVANAPHIKIPTNTFCHTVVKGFLNDIILKLDELYKEDSNIDKVFVSGRYHQTQLFWEQVTEINKDPTFADNIVSLSGDSGHDTSSGAVRHGINSEGRPSQFPEHDGFQQQRTKFAEPPLECFNIKDDFVLGIDLGNLLSGCSYKAPSEQSVQVVKNWHRKPHGDKNGRIAAAIIVKDRKHGPFKLLYWGDKAKCEKRKKGEHLVEDIKLNLCEKDTTQFYNNNFLQGRDFFTFADLLEEYPVLRRNDTFCLLTFYLANLIEHFRKCQNLKTGQKLCIVLTAPSMWSTVTRHKIIQKAIEKNIVGKKDKLKIKIINELEAATIAYEPCLSQLQNGNNPLTFILADIGGKTADVSTFQLSSKNVKGNLVRTISSLNNDRGGVCGASFLKKRFSDLVASILRDNTIVKYGVQPHLDYYVGYFITRLEENHFKHSVMKREKWFEIPLYPDSPIKLSSDRGNYNHHIDPVDKKLRILYRDINDCVFEPLVKKITDLLKVQVEQSVAPVDVIVLVGGFSNSTYLQERIKQTIPVSLKLIIENTDVPLYNRSTCVSQGAASYFMNSQLLSHTYANQTYAMSVDNKDTKNALMCIVRKNDFVQGSIYQHLIHVTFPNDAIIEISACCEASISADRNMKAGDFVPLADVRHFVQMVKYTYAMPEVLFKPFKAGDKVSLQVSFQITSQGDLDVKISLVLDQEIKKKHNLSSCLKSFRV